ncbi:MAG: hypothetical protein A2W19_05225 [Spirochaetes bacterium RBG_16_49_21]|nr:MAG: hypothetical protein A2W19_05225 [Spirochaetes bacterium RBG_16_49_21]
MAGKTWDDHYASEKAGLRYPDENLVRLLTKELSRLKKPLPLTAVDIGCGSGRHLKLLSDLGIGYVLGLDSSSNALRMAKKRFSWPLLLADASNIPLKDASADIAVAWGSLHYGRKEQLPVMLGEIERILARKGHLFATLRSIRDTHLKTGKHLGNDVWMTRLDDISGSVVSFYSEDELIRAFSLFTEFKFGLMERTLVGDTSALISHWVVHAVK